MSSFGLSGVGECRVLNFEKKELREIERLKLVTLSFGYEYKI